ncbi:hypothetical protein [Tateyamaria sp. SN6-1]|uniref:hypothetical protein n=1 Tax=Tateyamaria sp. SN6-1 TaxID=3092148 RepID=UPI0039F46EDD
MRLRSLGMVRRHGICRREECSVAGTGRSAQVTGLTKQAPHFVNVTLASAVMRVPRRLDGNGRSGAFACRMDDRDVSKRATTSPTILMFPDNRF